MDNIGKPERATQNRVIQLFRDELNYRYLGDWHERENNSNIEETLLSEYLTRNGYNTAQISGAIKKLKDAASQHSQNLYNKNKAVYSLLRYGAAIKTSVSENTETIHFIDWKNPQANDFAIAEEVTLKGENTRRPDLVLYVNGIAIGVIELKNSRVSIGDGIRQNSQINAPNLTSGFSQRCNLSLQAMTAKVCVTGQSAHKKSIF